MTSTRENCLGSECAHYDECFVMKARKQALAADVVVVNHHLFFADVMLRDEGVAELLPACNTVIFDEAHQLPETASLFFGETRVDRAADRTRARCAHRGRDAGARISPRCRTRRSALDKAARDLRLVVQRGQRAPAVPVRWTATASSTRGAGDASMTNSTRWPRLLESAGRAQRGAGEMLAARAWRCATSSRAGATAATTSTACAGSRCFSHSLQLNATPLSIAEIFQQADRATSRAPGYSLRPRWR